MNRNDSVINLSCGRGFLVECNISSDFEMKDALPRAKKFKIVALCECRLPEDMQYCDTPDKAADYWRLNIATNPYFNPDCECLAVLMLNTRCRVRGHHLVTHGTMDTLLVHPREVFRAAVIAGASAIVLMHNHPSGEATPSEADIKVTRDLIRAGQLMKIDVLDHVKATARFSAQGFLLPIILFFEHRRP